MTASTHVPREVEEYLAAVRDALDDVPALERDELVADVESSLLEAAADTGGPIAARLGPPEAFAAELRAAAGLHEPAPPPPRRSAVAARLERLRVRLRAHPATAAFARVGSELAPIWWVARAYVAVGFTAYVLDADWSTRYPLVPRIGSAELGFALVVAAALASVAIGLAWRRRGSPLPRVAALANVALLLAAVPVAVEVTDASAHDALVAAAYAPAPAPPPGLVYDGQPVANIYPYTREGRLLHDVLLYDGAGRPLEIPAAPGLDPDRRVVVTNGNRPLFNVFPIRYYEPGTRRIARPNAAPYVELPLVLTPPLPARGANG